MGSVGSGFALHFAWSSLVSLYEMLVLVHLLHILIPGLFIHICR